MRAGDGQGVIDAARRPVLRAPERAAETLSDSVVSISVSTTAARDWTYSRAPSDCAHLGTRLPAVRLAYPKRRYASSV